MRYKPFGRSEENVSRLGFGAWGIGQHMWVGAEDKQSLKVLHKAIDAGITLFDSAYVYGRGHSEQLLGRAERESGQTLFLTSKIPSKKYEWPASDDSTLEESFPTDHIIAMTEKSLRNFRRDYIDLQQFHVWNDAWAERDEWKEAIVKLKEQGKVRFFGISINDHQPTNGMKAGASGLIDSFQVIFNLFDQSPIDTLFPFCLEHNISVIARVPFDEGGLTGRITPDTEFPEGDWRNNYFRDDRKQQVWEHVQAIETDIKGCCDTVAEAALRFDMSFDAVTSVIPGMRRMESLQANLAAEAKGPLPADMVEKLKKHRWLRNFYKH
ncbi:MAG: aldo/keto reductase [Calditrichaeota bacterium]|nr:MAG: aldo/keto reductase [Calditrichota bacterium]